MATIQPSDESPAFVDFDEFVAYQLGEVKSAVRSTDLTTAIVGSFAWVSALCALFVISDQWLFADGWSMVARWIWLAVLVSGLGWWLTRTLLHPLLRKVSPLYAAKELETAVPALRRNLVNLVDLQSAGRPVAPAVLKALQKRAAVSLEEVQPRQAIDHTHLLWVSCALLATVVLLAVYAVMSPKPIWPSLWRMIPFTSIDAPTETLIREVTPGSTVRLAGSMLDVEAQLAGRIPELVELKFTTVDQQFVDETVRMAPVGQGGARFEARLLGERGEGFTQSFSYYIQAGDARSAIYQVSIVTPPHANVEEVEIQAPAYTGIEKQVSRGGAIHAWVGSEVKIRAMANQPVTSATMIFFDDDGMTPTGEELPVRLSQNRELTADYRPQLREDGTYARYYSIIVRTAGGETDPAPTIYPIALQIDQPPEIRMVLPENDVAAAANSTVGFVFTARDVDFLLGPMTLIAEKQGQIIAREELAAGGVSQQTAKTTLRLDRFALQENDELKVYATVQDNRQPTPNTARSDTRLIRIQGVLPPQKQQEQRQQAEKQAQQVEEQARQNAAQNQAGNEPPADPAQQDPGQAPEAMSDRPQEGEGNPGQNANDPSQANDPTRAKDKRAGEGMNQNDSQSRDDIPTSDRSDNANGKPGEERGDPSENNRTEGKSASERKGENQDSSRQQNNDSGSKTSPENTPADPKNQSGSSGQPKSNQQDPNQQDSGPQNMGQQNKGQQGSNKSDQGLSPNGEDDSEALKRLLEKARQESRQPNSKGQESGNESRQEDKVQPEHEADKSSSGGQSDDRKRGDEGSSKESMTEDSTNSSKENSAEKQPPGNDPRQGASSQNSPGEMNAPQASKEPANPKERMADGQTKPPGDSQPESAETGDTGKPSSPQSKNSSQPMSGNEKESQSRANGEKSDSAGDENSSAKNPGASGNESAKNGKGSRPNDQSLKPNSDNPAIASDPDGNPSGTDPSQPGGQKNKASDPSMGQPSEKLQGKSQEGARMTRCRLKGAPVKMDRRET